MGVFGQVELSEAVAERAISGAELIDLRVQLAQIVFNGGQIGAGAACLCQLPFELRSARL